MDINKPRYTPMSRRRRIYEGKAKVLYEGPEPGTLIQHFKDDATAFNAKKHEIIEGKGVLNNRISEYVFQHLNDIGVPTHFIKRLNMREQLIREVEIIPLEVVVRNVAAGSLSERLGLEEGTQLPRSIFEFYRAFPADAEFNAAQRSSMNVPLLLAAGERSPFNRFIPGIAEGLRAHGCANVKTEVIQGSSHYVADEQPAAVAELIERYASL